MAMMTYSIPYLHNLIRLIVMAVKFTLINVAIYLQSYQLFLNRLGFNPDAWLDELNSFKSIEIIAGGTVDQLKDSCRQVGKKFSFGLKLIPALE